MEMAKLKSPHQSDKSAYVNYATRVHQERVLLDQKEVLEEELKFLQQTLSYLVLHNTTASPSNPAVMAVSSVIKAKKGKLTDLVNF